MARAFKVTVVLVVIGALAAIAYKRGRPDSDAGNPLAVEINRHQRGAVPHQHVIG